MAVVITKTLQRRLETELSARFSNLHTLLKGRDLRSASEGTDRGFWTYPETMCALQGDKLSIALAIEDFTAILKQLKALK